MSLNDLNIALSQIRPGLHAWLAPAGMWLRGPGVNQKVRLNKVGALMRAHGSPLSIEDCVQVGALIRQYREKKEAA